MMLWNFIEQRKRQAFLVGNHLFDEEKAKEELLSRAVREWAEANPDELKKLIGFDPSDESAAWLAFLDHRVSQLETQGG